MSAHSGKRHQPSTGASAARGLTKVVIIMLTVPAKIIEFLTNPPGSAILIGLGVLYFAGVSAEGYWQAMPPEGKAAFIPKPFINDGANLALLLTALTSGAFWLASVVSLLIQGIQAFVLREVEVAKAIAAYNEVAGYRVPDEKEGQLDIAKYRRERVRSAGMRMVRTRGALIAVTYLIDAAQAIWNYPLMGQTSAQTFINCVWIVASIFGTEAMINLFWSAIAPIKNKPEVEVL